MKNANQSPPNLGLFPHNHAGLRDVRLNATGKATGHPPASERAGLGLGLGRVFVCVHGKRRESLPMLSHSWLNQGVYSHLLNHANGTPIGTISRRRAVQERASSDRRPPARGGRRLRKDVISHHQTSAFFRTTTLDCAMFDSTRPEKRPDRLEVVSRAASRASTTYHCSNVVPQGPLLRPGKSARRSSAGFSLHRLFCPIG
jgi:hypothetical protein